MDIIKEYKNYCNDLNLDYKQSKNKKRFINDCILYQIKLFGLKKIIEKGGIEKTTKKLNKILKEV